MSMIEKVAAREAISQLLADAGINRETIDELLRKAIDDKVEKRVGPIIREKSDRIDQYISDRYDRAMGKAITDHINKAFPYAKVEITLVKEPTLEQKLEQE